MDKKEDTPLDVAVGNLYVELYKLRVQKRYQEEYDAMGTLITMFQKDRQHLREKHGVRP